MKSFVPRDSARFPASTAVISWEPSKAAAVRTRLSALGYGTMYSEEQQKHATRVLLCAAAGILTFEVACDPFTLPCSTGGVPCESPVLTRSTCLLAHPCSEGLVLSDANHDTFRKTHAPKWMQLPPNGTGFVVASSLPAYATSWVVEALLQVGRRFADRYMARAGSDAIIVTAASSREGGLVIGDQSTVKGLQTGLQLMCALPHSPGEEPSAEH